MVGAASLHPAKQRRLSARMPAAPDHRVLLRPLGGGSARTIIVTSEAQDFIPALMEDLQAADWRARLDAMRRRRLGKTDAVLELNQPIHRRFQIALFEAVCDQPGQPRLDPAKITGTGVVVRRMRGEGAMRRREAWLKRGRSIDGWTPLHQPDADPDPARTKAGHPANVAIREAMARRTGRQEKPAAETVHGLYPAPPEVCDALKRTVLFAVIPVVSSERSDLPFAGIDFRALPSAERAEMARHFSAYLGQHPGHRMPRAGETLDSDWNVLDPATRAADPHLASFGTFLYQVMAELNILGGGRAARALLAVLRSIRLPTAEDAQGRATATIDAATFVERAGPVLVAREDNGSNFRMPLRWPVVNAADGARLTDAALACLTEQYRARVAAPAKFADDDARYVVRAFARVARHDGCPDKLVWSMESEPFRILPWWDGEGPGTTIKLPDIRKLRNVKPSVAFEMPPAIANLLKGDMTELAEGKGSTAGPEIGWLCSFSIPFITICAFIVLHIFLALFDIIFRWLLFIKICIPIPKLPPPAPPGGP